MRVKVDSNKGIYPEFGRIVLDYCKDDHDEMPMVDLSMNLPPCQLQELPYLRLVLLCLAFIMCLVEIPCTSLFLTNIDPLRCKNFEGISDKIEAIIYKGIDHHFGKSQII